MGAAGGGPAVTASVEELRLASSPLTGAGTARPVTGDETARIALGLEPFTEHDGEPACDWCGRSDPPGGLADESLGGPPVHACHDEGTCYRTRDERLPGWVDRQFPGWRDSWAALQAAWDQDYQPAALSAPPAWEPSRDEASPEFLAALAMVREAVDERVPGSLLCLSDRARALELSAAAPDCQPPPPDCPPAPPPALVTWDPWAHTMRADRNRHHTLGHLLASQPGVHSAADALARKAVPGSHDTGR
jgi:hypothetical protein